MNKTDLMKAVATKTGIQKGDAEQVVDAVFDTIGDTLVIGDYVYIAGFGKFNAEPTKARTGRNPQTGDTIEIPSKNKPKFKPAKGLNDKLNP